MAIPAAASAPIQPAITPSEGVPPTTTGQRDDNASVNPKAKATRTGATALLRPGSGTNTSAPATRVNTSRKPNSVPSESVRLTGIAAQIAQ